MIPVVLAIGDQIVEAYSRIGLERAKEKERRAKDAACTWSLCSI